MAITTDILKFKRGKYATLPAVEKLTSADIGTFYITTDEKAMYVNVRNDDKEIERIRLGQIITYTTEKDFIAWTKQTQPPYDTNAFYYIESENILCKWLSSGSWQQINLSEKAEINSLKTDIEGIKTNYNNVISFLVGSYEGASWRDEFDKNFPADAEGTLRNVTDVLKELSDNLSSLDEKIDNVQGQIEQEVKDRESAIATVETSVAGLSSNVETIQGSVNKLHNFVIDETDTDKDESYDSPTKTLTTRVRNLEKMVGIDESDDGQGSLIARIETIETTYATKAYVDDTTATIVTEIAAVKALAEAAQKTADEVKVSVEAAQESADNANTAAGKAQETADAAKTAAEKAQTDATAALTDAATNATDIAELRNDLGEKSDDTVDSSSENSRYNDLSVFQRLNWIRNNINSISDDIKGQINAANGMTYKGKISDADELPTEGVRVGDTYIVSIIDPTQQYITISGTLLDNSSGADENATTGDLAIASGDEDQNGIIAAGTLKWSIVNTGYIDAHESKLSFSQKDGENSATIDLKSYVGTSLGSIPIVSDSLQISVTYDALDLEKQNPRLTFNNVWEEF